jgi:hypothetical protein
LLGLSNKIPEGNAEWYLQVACHQPEKSKGCGSYFNNGGLDERENSARKVKRSVWPQYLVEPQ